MHLAYATGLMDFQTCDPPFSFYEFIDRLMPGEKTNRNPLRRLCTLMRKMHARSFLLENLRLNEEMQQEKEMLDRKLGGDIEFVATRLTFFCIPHDKLSWEVSPETFEKYVLAYAVIVTFTLPDNHKFSHILEAVVRPPSVVLTEEIKEPFIETTTNYYVHNTREWLTSIGPKEDTKALKITGSFFSQQNTLTSVCAHAALRIAMNSSILDNTSKLTNHFINDQLSLHPDQWHRGLGTDEIVRVVSNHGYEVHTVNFLEKTDLEYDHFLYPALESGCPTILGIQGWDVIRSQLTSHVVTILGHTTNSDRWDPQARCGYGNYPLKPYISSACWCDHYIMSDDNFGMFSTMPSDMLRNFIVPSKNPYLHASMAITIVPKSVAMPGYIAEQAATVHARAFIERINSIQGINIWLKRLGNTIQRDYSKPGNRDIVCRTILQTAQRYRHYVESQNVLLSAEQSEILSRLPEYLWVSELTLPNLYTGNKHKLGDVVINAGATPEEHVEGNSFVLSWFPEIILLGPELTLQSWGINTHVPLIRNTKPPVLEW